MHQRSRKLVGDKVGMEAGEEDTMAADSMQFPTGVDFMEGPPIMADTTGDIIMDIMAGVIMGVITGGITHTGTHFIGELGSLAGLFGAGLMCPMGGGLI